MNINEMNVTDIIRTFLDTNGFDGLVDPYDECGCSKDNFNPCGEPNINCYPGYKGSCTCDDKGCDFHIFREKPDDYEVVE